MQVFTLTRSTNPKGTFDETIKDTRAQETVMKNFQSTSIDVTSNRTCIITSLLTTGATPCGNIQHPNAPMTGTIRSVPIVAHKVTHGKMS